MVSAVHYVLNGAAEESRAGVAARCRFSAEHRKLGQVAMDWILVGEVADAGRVRHIHQLARSS
ncbi:hypothetical protein OH799_07380 [Nocardia sp. NBC_00881]|uniref:hypothetical protein n=1 Tax=Nocardia sp. NBC_00881 TaxID=2975995 RepID=UPI003864CBCA|nr:hypothetical protein OH799_07380 [Nocardia sp. NBC_00881]